MADQPKDVSCAFDIHLPGGSLCNIQVINRGEMIHLGHRLESRILMDPESREGEIPLNDLDAGGGSRNSRFQLLNPASGKRLELRLDQNQKSRGLVPEQSGYEFSSKKTRKSGQEAHESRVACSPSFWKESE